MQALHSICQFRNETADCSEATRQNYVSTESMIPNRGGVATCSGVPARGKIKRYRKGDILVSNIRPYFKKIWRANASGTCSNDILVFIPHRCSSSFLYWILSSDDFFDYMTKTSRGTKMPRGDKAAIMQYRIDLPSEATQEAICSILRPLNRQIELNNRINDYLEQCVMALFGQFYMGRWGEDLPEGWSYQRVEEFSEKVAMGPFGSSIKVDTFVDEGIPIISGAHLHGLLLEELGYNYITEEHAERLTNSMVYPGDIVFTHAGNIGQASLITKWANEPKYMISQRQFYLRCNSDKMLPEIPALYFHTRIGRHVLTANSSSTGVPSIAQPSSYLKSIEVIVPDMASQRSFVERIEPMLHQYVANENETRRLERLRDALLPKLMSGEIDVSKVELPTQLNNHLSDC